jgi:hypothetical protein
MYNIVSRSCGKNLENGNRSIINQQSYNLNQLQTKFPNDENESEMNIEKPGQTVKTDKPTH